MTRNPQAMFTVQVLRQKPVGFGTARARYVAVVWIGGIRFQSEASDETTALQRAMEAQARLEQAGVEFDPPEVA